MVVFDSRPGGYTEADARAYVAAVTPEQIDIYLSTFRRLDTAFPILLTIALLGSIWLNTSGAPRSRRAIACLGPVLYLAFDLLENAAVNLVLKCEARAVFEHLRCPVNYGDLVAQASIYTQAKWMTLVLSLLVVFWAWRFTPEPEKTALH